MRWIRGRATGSTSAAIITCRAATTSTGPTTGITSPASDDP
ncbi:hypothetical protein [Clavibacter michiganensis]|nr:hypothetical protein [Clavibacter michiganensis]KDP91407.1 hypothetical protein W824_07385 [Clavibacter cf. michiganensis LMG 26808]